MAWVTAGAIDEAWEYYQPDPEAEYMVHRRQAAGFDGMGDLDGGSYRAEHTGMLHGMRFGKGGKALACCNFRLRPLRLTAREARTVQPIRTCATCQTWFRPDASKPHRKYCSSGCVLRKGAPRTLADKVCPTCGVQFHPRVAASQYCSRACVPAVGGSPPPEQARLDQFRELYLSGADTKTICRTLSVTKPTLRRWRRSLGLQARPIGAPRKDGMAKCGY